MFPIEACMSCLDAKAICSGIDSVKCARCKARHTLCSFYVIVSLSLHFSHLILPQEDTPEGCACAKILISRRLPVESQAPTSATSSAVKPEPDSKCTLCPRKKVHVEAAPTPRSSLLKGTVLTAASAARTTTPSPSVDLALTFCSILVTAIEALDKSLEEQGVSEQALGKHRTRD